MVATVLDARHTDTLSRSSIWRILHDIDLKPHQSEYWLNSHDEDFNAKAHLICQLDAQAIEAEQQGRLVICCDEKTGMHVLERKAPPKPAQPGRRERREHEYIRPGTRVLINALAVATGHLAWPLGSTRTATDFVAHLQRAYQSLPRMERYEWGMDNLPPPGGWPFAAWWRGGARGPLNLRSAKKVRNAGPSWVLHVTAMSFLARPNTARGSTQLRCMDAEPYRHVLEYH